MLRNILTHYQSQLFYWTFDHMLTILFGFDRVNKTWNFLKKVSWRLKSIKLLKNKINIQRSHQEFFIIKECWRHRTMGLIRNLKTRAGLAVAWDQLCFEGGNIWMLILIPVELVVLVVYRGAKEVLMCKAARQASHRPPLTLPRHQLPLTLSRLTLPRHQPRLMLRRQPHLKLQRHLFLSKLNLHLLIPTKCRWELLLSNPFKAQKAWS